MNELSEDDVKEMIGRFQHNFSPDGQSIMSYANAYDNYELVF